jgi:transcriptional regulatory protein RtcR
VELVNEEMQRLRDQWGNTGSREPSTEGVLDGLVDIVKIDRFDQAGLAEVVRVCRTSKTISEAGRRLFAVSRAEKARPNDADRLRKYLQRFGLNWQDIHN